MSEASVRVASMSSAASEPVTSSTRRPGSTATEASSASSSAGSGEPVELRLHWVFHVRGGLIDVVRAFHSCDEARAAL